MLNATISIRLGRLYQGVKKIVHRVHRADNPIPWDDFITQPLDKSCPMALIVKEHRLTISKGHSMMDRPGVPKGIE